MRKLIVFMMITPDGYYEGPDHEIDWHNVDAEFNDFAIDQIRSVDTLIFGRVTYELMAGYWPTPEALKDDPVVADKMNSMPKIVFSKTLMKADWNNTKLVKTDASEEILRLKQQAGKDLIIFGSSDLAADLSGRGLIDEYRLIISPVLLGIGKSVFKGLNKRVNLKLLKTKTFNSGNVLLYYEPA